MLAFHHTMIYEVTCSGSIGDSSKGIQRYAQLQNVHMDLKLVLVSSMCTKLVKMHGTFQCSAS